MSDSSSAGWRRAYVGVGANLGDARATVLAAVDALGVVPGVLVVAVSPLYTSAPLGEGADGPEYVNAVLELSTALDAYALLAVLQTVELQFGRTRSYRNAPRTLDLDVLLFGGEVIASDVLTIPHPRMEERAFVILPLFDLNPELLWHNARNESRSVRDVRAQLAEQDIQLLEVST